MEDETYTCLVIRAQSGDTLAFDAIVHRFQDRAVGYARSQLRFDRTAAEDAAQEAFVQAWRYLPTLKAPEAFPAWLRRIVFKYCDRIRRTTGIDTVPLDEAFYLSGGIEPARAFEVGENAALLRHALEALPEREREAALLYYRDNHDLAEIASFLEVPRTTVKSRLHAARKRLRKELWEMAQEILEQEKPSRDETFVGNVLVRIMRDFRAQMLVDPHTADRGLLAEGRETLDAALAGREPLDWETVRDGIDLLTRQDERVRVVSLLMRYLAQPLDDSHAAWAFYRLGICAAWSGNALAAVLAYEAFDRWLPGKRPRISTHAPYDPVPALEMAASCYQDADELRMLTLGASTQFATAWRGIWREDDYLAMVDDLLRRVPTTDSNRPLRFGVLRTACETCEGIDRIDRARGYVAQMYALSDEPTNSDDRAHWRAKALEHDFSLCSRTQDEDGMLEKATGLTELLATAEGGWAREERHNLACQLTWKGRHDLALPLFEQNLIAGGHNGWGYLMHAAVLWKLTADRARTLQLIRDAAVRESRDLTRDFSVMPEFADVKDDPEFLAAVSKPK